MRALAPLFCLAAALPTWAAEETVLVDFDYPDDRAAQAAWRPDENSQPATLRERAEGTALQLNADFTGTSQRAVYDLDIDLDLTRWGRYSLDLYVDDPGLVGHFTLYFRTEHGWYGQGIPLPRKGWSTVPFSTAGFGTEDQPDGWDKITGIRLSAWRGADRRGFMAVDNLKAYRENKVVVLNTHALDAGHTEASSIRRFAQSMVDLLSQAGIMAGIVTDDDVEQGALADRELAIFPYNPDISEAEAEATLTFIQGGGKVMFFYQLPDNLADALGVRKTGYLQRERDGQFAEIRLAGEGLEGLPAAVQQASWNITTVEPVEGRATALGRWFDAAGQDIGQVALTISDAGVFMTHVLLDDDAAGKAKLMLALVGHYCPEVWPTVAQKALDGPAQIGHFGNLEAARRWLDAAANGAGGEVVRAKLTLADEARAKARGLFDGGRFSASIEAADQADNALRAAYLAAMPPRPGEFRALWNHSGTGAFPDGWAASMKNLHDCGFNAILPNMLWGGSALYDSKYLPHSPVVAEKGDQIADCVAAAKPYGIEVHVWKVNWNLGWQVPDELVTELRAQGRLQMGFDGSEVRWLCPSNPDNQQLELDSMVEVARNYEVDGVHFDYIRYPDQNSCFCPRCRAAFEQTIGHPVEHWPDDVRTEALRAQWTQFRCDNISRLVKAVAEDVREIKPDCQISAAVFSNYPGCKDGVGQDWVHWIQEGWLDFVCPMDYTNSDSSYAGTVARQMSQIQGRIPFYPGLGATLGTWNLTADRIAGQIKIGRELGADGFTIFNYGPGIATAELPSLGAGILGDAAPPPHHGPAYTFDVGAVQDRPTYGRYAAPGEAVEVAVERGTDVPGRSVEQIQATVVLEDSAGKLVRELGPAPEPGKPSRVTVAVEQRGLYRVAVRGEATVAGRRRPFEVRSLPIIIGGLADDVAPLL